MPNNGLNTRLMWTIYSLAWVVYSIVIGFIVQFDEFNQGNFNWAMATRTVLTTLPTGLVLALIWPLSDKLNQRRIETAQLVAIHFFCAFAFAVIWHFFGMAMYFMLLGTVPKRSIAWYIWPFLYNMMMYGVIASIFHGIRSSEARRLQDLAFTQAQKLLVSAELNALRNKLNPHFLFNTLNSIITLVRKDAVAAEAALFRFSDMLRYILRTEKSGQDRVTLDEELDFVRDYLSLESLRLGQRLQVEWQIDPTTTAISIPALSVQPLVENSIKHAFNPRSQPGLLKISTEMRHTENCLRISVSDDGPGWDASANEAKQSSEEGMGLRTIERRLKLEYGERARFRIDTAPSAGFAVYLDIPYQ